MPFRLLQYLRLLTPVIFAFVTLNFLHQDWTVARTIGKYAFVAMVAMGIAGALLGLVFLFVGVRLRCPLCGKWGQEAAELNGRPWMECTNCGVIRCQGFLGLGFVRESESDKAE